MGFYTAVGYIYNSNEGSVTRKVDLGIEKAMACTGQSMWEAIDRAYEADDRERLLRAFPSYQYVLFVNVCSLRIFHPGHSAGLGERKREFVELCERYRDAFLGVDSENIRGKRM